MNQMKKTSEGGLRIKSPINIIDPPGWLIPVLVWQLFFCFLCAVVHADQEEDRSLHQLWPEEKIQRRRAYWRICGESSAR